MTGLAIAAAGMAALAAKATLVLCVALVLAWLARRGSARTLHSLWTTTFALLLALPALSFLGPSWTAPILPTRDALAESPPLEALADQAPAGGPAQDLVRSSVGPGSLAPDSRHPASREARPIALAPGSLERTSAPRLAGVVLMIWALGSAAALISLAVGALRFRKLARRASPLEDPAWVGQTNAIRWQLGLGTEVGLLHGEFVPTPMTGGLWKPVILLPASAETWTPERRAVVLAHELVHIRRRDAFRQIVSRAVVAFYWFHPLSWLASRYANAASERSCDEEVLTLGTRPSEYARHLFSLASETAGVPRVLALPMVQRSQLENRIMSILKQHRPRFSAAGTTAVLAVAGATGLLIACADPVPRDPMAQPSPPVETGAPGDLRAENSATPVTDPEPTLPVDPVPDAAPPSTLPVESAPPAAPPLEPAPRPDPQPATSAAPVPAVISRQALECNPGNSVVVARSSGEWTLQQRVDGMRLCMRNRGNVEMVSDGTAVESMDDGSWLVLESQAARLHRLVIAPGPGGLEHDWSIDGRSQAFDANAREWRDLMLTVMNGYREAQEVRGEEAGLRGEIASHRGHVASLRGVIASHRGHVAGLRGEIASHRGHVAALRGRIASHRGRAAALRGQMVSRMGRASRQQRATRAAAVGMYEAREAARQALESVEVQEALEAARQSLESVEVQEALEAARAAVEAVDSLLVTETLAEITQQISEDIRVIREDTRQLQGETEGIQRDLDARLAELEAELAEYDLDERIAEVEAEIEEYNLNGKVREIEADIERYDLDGKAREIAARIDQYDLNGKIRDIEAQIEELDANRRADEIERSLQDEVATLRALIG